MKKNYAVVLFTAGMLMLGKTSMSQTAKPAAPAQARTTSPATAKKPAGTATAAAMPGAAALKASLDRGKIVYQQQCLACHQADAGGVPNMNPPLIRTKWILGDKTTLVQIVLKGLTGEIEVDGDSYHNVMAPHSELSDEQIADVLTYVRNNFGNKARAITAAEVKAIRAKTK